MIYRIFRRGLDVFRRETVLCIAGVLAVASAFLVPPSPAYLDYIDWNTLAMLFSLMAVVKGFQKAGLFLRLGGGLLRRTCTSRGMLLILVFLPFFFSMLVTNDVALITFVPLALTVLPLAGQEQFTVPLVVLQTAAANLGSMLTPMGNPQNLYLYTQSGMGFGALCLLMLPYVALSGVCLAAMCLALPAKPVTAAPAQGQALPGQRRVLALSGVGFLLCLGGIFKVLPPLAIAAVIGVFLLLADRKLLAGVDYALLATFVAFFVFIGNLGSLAGFRDFLASILDGREVVVSVLSSQVISNVPAALLLSGFTQDWEGLLIGCNLGGLGTLIASMASLISYKQIAQVYPRRKPAYLVWFTVCNVALLALLLTAWILLR